MKPAEIFYYIVKRYPDGRMWYEGYSDEQEARGRAERNAEYEYVGTTLPADVVAYCRQQETAFVEAEFHMQPLQGSEEQIDWARDIRARYARYLEDRSGTDAARLRYQSEEAERLQAKWWIDHRYQLGVTNSASRFIAEGR